MVLDSRFPERNVNICSNYGGLGDNIARLTAIRYVLQEHPHVRMTVYWHDYFVKLAQTLLPEGETLRHKGITEMAFADDSIPLIDFIPEQINSLSLGLIEHAFLIIAQRLPRPEDRVYPRYSPQWERGIDVEGFDNYVVLTPSFTSPTREWRGEEITKTIQGLHETGFKTVLLGNSSQLPLGNGHKIQGKAPIGFNPSIASLNLMDQTSLIDCLEIMSHAKCVMGVDNGLLHLSACTGTPSVWGFTSVEAQHRLPLGIRAGLVLPEGRYGCQSKPYLVKHDFRSCMFEQCLCVEGMKSEKFLQQFKILLDIP